MGAIVFAHESDISACPDVTTVGTTTGDGFASGSLAGCGAAGGSFAGCGATGRQTTSAGFCFSHCHDLLLELCVTTREQSYGIYLPALSVSGSYHYKSA